MALRGSGLQWTDRRSAPARRVNLLGGSLGSNWWHGDKNTFILIDGFFVDELDIFSLAVRVSGRPFRPPRLGAPLRLRAGLGRLGSVKACNSLNIRQQTMAGSLRE